MAARTLHKLSARGISKLKSIPGRHSDGGNLYLEVTPGLSASWSFLSKVTGQCGFGSDLSPEGVRKAREKAAEWRAAIGQGINPREAQRAIAAPPSKTFGEAYGELVASKRPQWRGASYARAWASTLETHCAALRDMPVADIGVAHVLEVLQPIWQRTPAAAAAVRGYIEATLDYAKAHGWRSGENPARWRGHLSLILPKRQRLERRHHAALHYEKIPEFLAELRNRGTVPAACLEFVTLTAVRANEATSATWAEIDKDARLWVIPAARMKTGREFRIPLSEPALAVLDRMAAARANDFVFPSRRGPVSCRTLLRLLAGAGATVHGMRSAFRDFAGDQTNFPREVCEHALAHVVGGTEGAYRRQDAFEKRAGLMEAWGRFCTPETNHKVVSPGSRSRK